MGWPTEPTTFDKELAKYRKVSVSLGRAIVRRAIERSKSCPNKVFLDNKTKHIDDCRKALSRIEAEMRQFLK